MILPVRPAREGLQLAVSPVLLLPIAFTTLVSAIPPAASMVNTHLQELSTVCPVISVASLAQMPLLVLPAGLQSQEAIFTSIQGHA